MIPAIYEKEFESIDATGNFELSGFAKGKYTDNSLPAFALNMKVKMLNSSIQIYQNQLTILISMPISATKVALKIIL